MPAASEAVRPHELRPGDCANARTPPDPDAVLAQLRRVTRAGGRIAALDLDTASTVVDHPDPETTRTILEAWADHFAGGRVARSLHRPFRQAGLHDATVEVHAAQVPADFLRARRRRRLHDRVHVFLVTGTVPD